MRELIELLLAALLSFTQPAALPGGVRVEPQLVDDAWVLACYAGCEEWAAFAPVAWRTYAYPTREAAINAYAMMRAVRFGCLYVPVGVDNPYSEAQRCAGFGRLD